MQKYILNSYKYYIFFMFLESKIFFILKILFFFKRKKIGSLSSIDTTAANLNIH